MKFLKQVRNKRYIVYAIYLVIFLLNNLLIQDYNDKLFFNLAIVFSLQFFILLFFKFDFIFFMTFLVSYLLLPSIILYYKISEKNLGLISLNMNKIHLNSIAIYIFVFIYIISLVALLLNFPNYEKKALNSGYFELENITITINNILIYVFTIIAFPRISIHSQDRFSMLLPGHAWNQFVIVAILFNLPYLTRKKSVMCSTFFAFVWFLLNGERADMSGLILGIIIIVLMSNKVKTKAKMYSISGLFIFAILFITIGKLRMSGASGSVTQAILSIGTFSTVSDVSYLLNISVDYVNNFGHTNGMATFNIIRSFIPFTSRPGIDVFIDSHYANPGGIPIISTMIMDGGIIAVTIITAIYSYLSSSLVKLGQNKFFRIEFILLLCSIPRMCWYGLYYIGPSLIFFVPFFYLMNNFVNGIYKNKSIRTIIKKIFCEE